MEYRNKFTKKIEKDKIRVADNPFLFELVEKKIGSNIKKEFK